MISCDYPAPIRAIDRIYNIRNLPPESRSGYLSLDLLMEVRA